jgi:hypothetical protein
MFKEETEEERSFRIQREAYYQKKREQKERNKNDF